MFINTTTGNIIDNQPKMERITTTKSKTFHPTAKKCCLRAKSFRQHSVVKTTMKTRLTKNRISSFSGLCSSVSTIMVTMLRQINTMMKMSKNCFVTKSKTNPWHIF